MPAGEVAITQDKFRLFSKNPTAISPECTIDAHGRQVLINSPFDVPAGMKIYFYVRQNYTLLDDEISYDVGTAHVTARSSVAAIVTKNIRHEQKYSAGDKCPDYVLSKIHKSSSAFMGGKPTQFLLDRNEITYQNLIAMLDAHSAPTDIVTIRRCRGKSNPQLSEIVRFLSARGVSKVHCSFCREKTLSISSPVKDLSGARPGS